MHAIVLLTSFRPTPRWHSQAYSHVYLVSSIHQPTRSGQASDGMKITLLVNFQSGCKASAGDAGLSQLWVASGWCLPRVCALSSEQCERYQLFPLWSNKLGANAVHFVRIILPDAYRFCLPLPTHFSLVNASCVKKNVHQERNQLETAFSSSIGDYLHQSE